MAPLFREALLEHLDDLEDLYLAEQRLLDLRAGKTQTVKLEDVMKRYAQEQRVSHDRILIISEGGKTEPNYFAVNKSLP